MTNNRRKHFFINKPMQTRFMIYVTLPMLIITSLIIGALYIGIWGSMLNAFSNEKLRNDLLTASRLTEYEQARAVKTTEDSSILSLFKQTEKLSLRQKEVFKQILDEANQEIIPKFLLLLFFIAWGTIYISHRIVGPLYRFSMTLDEMASGNFRARIHLRNHDEGRSVEKHFNTTLEILDKKFAKLKSIIRENEKNPEDMTAQLKDELSKIKTSADA